MNTAQNTPEGVPVGTRGGRIHYADRVYLASVGFMLIGSVVRVFWDILIHDGLRQPISFSEFQKSASSTWNQITIIALLTGCIVSPVFSPRPTWQRVLMSTFGFIAFFALPTAIDDFAFKCGFLRIIQ